MPEWRRTINAMGEIPVLEIDGVRHSQIAPILLRFAEQFGRFRGETEAERHEVLRWLFWDNHKLSGYMAAYRYYRAFTLSPDAGMLAFFRRRLADFLGILDGHVAKQRFVAGDDPTIVDISMIAYLSYPKEEVGHELAVSHPAIAAWLGRVAAIPDWRAPYDLLPGKRLQRYA